MYNFTLLSGVKQSDSVMRSVSIISALFYSHSFPSTGLLPNVGSSFLCFSLWLCFSLECPVLGCFIIFPGDFLSVGRHSSAGISAWSWREVERCVGRRSQPLWAPIVASILSPSPLLLSLLLQARKTCALQSVPSWRNCMRRVLFRVTSQWDFNDPEERWWWWPRETTPQVHNGPSGRTASRTACVAPGISVHGDEWAVASECPFSLWQAAG